MRNRLRKYLNKGGEMGDFLFDREDLKELSKEIKESKGYFLGITILNKDDKLQHFLVSSNFPKIDLLKSVKKIKQLAVEDLEAEGIDLTKDVFFRRGGGDDVEDTK